MDVGIRGFPLAATKSTDVVGVDFDPYDAADQHVDIWPSWIPMHTYRKWHVFVNGFYAGLKCGAWENLPPCPSLWTDESHYWDGGVVIAYEGKRYGSGIVVGITALIGYMELAG